MSGAAKTAAATGKAVVETSKVGGRRELAFDALGDVVADAERLAAAEREGRLVLLGNWTLGQIFGHLAYWADGAFEGYEVVPPWFVRLLGPLMKKSVLRRPVKVGFKLPGAPGGTYGTTAYSTQEGLERLRKAFARLDAQVPPRPNPAFGKMTHHEWKQLHLRHAEGHLSFAVPK